MKLISSCLLLMFLAVHPAPARAAEDAPASTSRPTGVDAPFLPRCLYDGGGWVLRDASTGEVAVGRLELAVSFPARRRGLQHRGGMPADAGLLLVPANAVHTRRMCFAIDLIYLDCQGNVIAVRRCVQPGRWFIPGVCGAQAVLETPAGASALHVGQRLRVSRASN